MVGPLPVKLSVRLPSVSDLNESFWRYDLGKHELEGIGYFCLRCGNARIIKHYIDAETGMVALD